MPGKSTKSTLVSIRLPNDLLAAIDRRLAGQVPYPDTRSGIIIKTLAREFLRSHHKKKGGNDER